MTDIILYLIIASIGFFLASRLKSSGKTKSKWAGTLQTVATCFILFVMGTRIGSNKEVIDNLTSIGLQALIITIVILLLTTISLHITRKLLGFNDVGVRSYENERKGLQNHNKRTENKKEASFDKMTFLIVAFVILGMAIGHFLVNRIFNDYDSFSNFASWLIRIGLCILLFFVGLDLGFDGSAVSNFKKAGPRILFFPLATIIGTMLGGVIVSFLFPLTIKEGLAIASGFGWYSLAPAIILDAGHVSASAISFIHNVMRELFSIMLIPFIAKHIGYVEASGVSGAPAMDICLPVVERATSSTVAVYSFITGVITSFLVPILVPLFI